ncbi:unnamed protein product [Oncorhynchus mykiss]|uniref:Receptor ligand binding region domain-containing protein n=1 Tax=Oncorhynchus mykiss TaxID=8022 RepID=A0A060YLN2_ONCMY|nr:unnamed protein product [Oncorhynchus mykiss]
MTGLGIWSTFGRFARLPFLAPCTVLLCFLIPESLSHPQPCQILKRIGHTVRVGALHLQPRLFSHDPTFRGKKEPLLEKITKSVNDHGLRSLRTKGTGNNQQRDRGSKSKNMYKQVESGSRVFMPRDSIILAMETLNRMVGLLPYNLSLELVMAVEAGLGELPAFSFSSSPTPVCEDPMSFLQSVCHTVIVQGVSAMMAFPQTRDELVKLEFIASALQIPVISVVQNEFKRQSKVRRLSLYKHNTPVHKHECQCCLTYCWGMNGTERLETRC